ncbi:MAG: mannose-1-phosphate guanylyltransferase [Bdellovibrio sp.]|nr:mannose-1-phosphate guanylyltransferase [Bdellovibrio sp.]
MIFPDLYLVVMAGGSGTRFWPKSTSRKPKQFLSFEKDKKETLFVKTLKRFVSIVPQENQLVITTEKLMAQVCYQAQCVKLLVEPQGRNTAPCIFWAAKEVQKLNPNGVILVVPSDHMVLDLDAFQKTILKACEWARKNDDLITLGVKPTGPETGYGYLKLGKNITESCQLVEAFVEKPNLKTAKEFLKSGNYLWNGGMFVWRVDVILSAFQQFMPEMEKAWVQAHGNVEKAYPNMVAISIDYGIMEKAKNVVTFTLDCGWDDLGSWVSVESLAETLSVGENSVLSGQIISMASKGNIIDVPKKLVALLGVSDLIIADYGGVLLVAHKSQAQDIKRLVEETKKTHPELV